MGKIDAGLIDGEDREDSDGGLSPPSGTCQCGAASVITLAVVSKGVDTLVKPFNEVGFVKYGQDGKTNWTRSKVRSPYAFHRWLERCADCWYRYGKNLRADLAVPPPPSNYTENMARMAWMWFMGEQVKDTQLDGLFKGREVSEEQARKYLYIVNEEAARLGMPEAVPSEFRLAGVWS